MQRRQPSPLTPPRADTTVGLRDGRRLSVAEWGPADGHPVIWLHGTPGSRLQLTEAARRYASEGDVRLVGVDRPGVGCSTPHIYADVAAFVADLEQLMDALGIDRAGVAGLSGGGAFALAAGARLPRRVATVAVLSGVAPTVGDDAVTGGLLGLGVLAAPLVRWGWRPIGSVLAGALRTARPVAATAVDAYALVSLPADRRILRRPDIRAMVVEGVVGEGSRQFSAPVADFAVLTRDWGFALADVGVPVLWWHGDHDQIVPYRHGCQVVQRLPDAELRTLKGENHLVCFAIADAVLRELAGRSVGR